MKLSIIAIILSFYAMAYGQADIDRLTHPIGHIIMDQHNMNFSEDTFYYNPYKPDTITISNTGGLSETYRMIFGYLESRDSVEVHFTTSNFCFIPDPMAGECHNKQHYRMEIQTPTFQGFINYVLNQKP